MTPALVQHRQRHRSQHARYAGHARDWAEIQERMLVPLFEAAYERLDVGPGTRLLGLGCGSGLALLLAAARGASVVGVDTDEARLALARERLLPEPEAAGHRDARLVLGEAEDVLAAGPPPTLVTAFDALPDAAGLARSAAGLERGTPVVLAGWGPAERCAAAPVLRLAERLADLAPSVGCWLPGGRDDLEELAVSSGLRLEGSGRVTCPFGYADRESAVRGLLSTGLYDAAVEATDRGRVVQELAEALHPHQRADGTVWMPNLFRYVIARTV